MELADLLLMILEQHKQENPTLIASIQPNSDVFRVVLVNGLGCTIPVSREFHIYTDVVSKYGGDEYACEYARIPIPIEHPDFIDMFKEDLLEWLKLNLALGRGL